MENTAAQQAIATLLAGFGGALGQRPGGQALAPQPAQAQMLALNGRRFQGTIQQWNGPKGFGFIRSPELRTIYPDRDIFIHISKCQGCNLKMGDTVDFGVFLDSSKRPQAIDVKMIGEGPGIPAVAGGQLALTAGGGGSQAPAYQQNPSMFTAPAPTGELDDLVSLEVEVPHDLLVLLAGDANAGLMDIVKRAGGDINIQFAPGEPPNKRHKTIQIKGPAVSVSLGSCLVMQRVSEVGRATGEAC